MNHLVAAPACLPFHVVHLRCAPWLYTGYVNCNDVAHLVDFTVHMCNTTPKISVCGSHNGFANVTDADIHGDHSGCDGSDAQYLSNSLRICRLGADAKLDTGRTVPAQYHCSWQTEEAFTRPCEALQAPSRFLESRSRYFLSSSSHHLHKFLDGVSCSIKE